MRILNISTDPAIADPHSAVCQRLRFIGQQAERYMVVGRADETVSFHLSPTTLIQTLKSRNKFFDWWRLKKIASEFLAGNPSDVITVQDPYFLGLLALWLAKKFYLGLEVQVHGFEKFSWLRHRVARFVLRRAGSVRTVSERLRRMLVTDFGVDHARIIVVPIYVETRGRGRARPRQAPADTFVFLSVARLVPVKNVALQLRALARVLIREPRVKLWIVGSGSEEEKLKALAERLGIGRAVVFWGWQKDVTKFYREAEAFLLTSEREGWPLVIVEAASFGLPIIMTDVGSAGELIKNGESGLVVPVGDETVLAGAMRALIEHLDLGERLGREARENARRLPTREDTLNLYRRSWELTLANRL